MLTIQDDVIYITVEGGVVVGSFASPDFKANRIVVIDYDELAETGEDEAMQKFIDTSFEREELVEVAISFWE